MDRVFIWQLVPWQHVHARIYGNTVSMATLLLWIHELLYPRLSFPESCTEMCTLILLSKFSALLWTLSHEHNISHSTSLSCWSFLCGEYKWKQRLQSLSCSQHHQLQRSFLRVCAGLLQEPDGRWNCTMQQ